MSSNSSTGDDGSEAISPKHHAQSILYPDFKCQDQSLRPSFIKPNTKLIVIDPKTKQPIMLPNTTETTSSSTSSISSVRSVVTPISNSVEVSSEISNRYKLLYEEGQFNPLNKDGYRRYSNEFLRSVASEKLNFSIPRQTLGEDTPLRLELICPSCRETTQYIMSKVTQQSAPKVNKIETELPTRKYNRDVWQSKAEFDTSKRNSMLEFLTLLNHNPDYHIKRVIDNHRMGESEKWANLIDLAFDRLHQGPSFCQLLFDSCKRLCNEHEIFRYRLIQKSQTEFEKEDIYEGLDVKKKKAYLEAEAYPCKRLMLIDELEEKMRSKKRRFLNTLKLIADLYNSDLLAGKIIVLVMKHLVTKSDNDSIEGLCDLISLTGRKLSTESHVFNSSSIECMEETITLLRKIVNPEDDGYATLDGRIKQRVLDTIDLSERAWMHNVKIRDSKVLSRPLDESS